MKTVSLAVPAFNEEENVPLLCQEISRVFSGGDLDWEIIFVDDGSTDRTFEVISRLARKDSRIKGIRLSRNFGHQAAILAGIQHAKGDCVISMDCDLQHPPSRLPDFIQEWRSGSQIVIGIREAQKETFFKRLSSGSFYRLYNLLTAQKLEMHSADFRLLDRSVINQLLCFPESDIFLRGVVSWVGFRLSYVRYAQPPREHGDSKYSLSKMIKLALKGTVSFSSRPLYLALAMGGVFIAFSIAYAAYILCDWCLGGKPVTGWASIIFLILIATGFQLLSLGVIGVYVASLFDEAKGRPRFIVWESVGLEEPPAERPEGKRITPK